MPNKRNLKDYGFLVLKGMGMGAADVVKSEAKRS